MKVDRQTFALQPLFDKLSNDFTPQATARDLAVRWPPCDYAVVSDPTLLEQILRNLIGNAIRYTEEGGVRVVCKETAGALTVRVIDTGVGIPEEERQAIFGEFHQLSNPERDRRYRNRTTAQGQKQRLSGAA